MRRKYLLWRRAFAIKQLNASHYRLAIWLRRYRLIEASGRMAPADCNPGKALEMAGGYWIVRVDVHISRLLIGPCLLALGAPA